MKHTKPNTATRGKKNRTVFEAKKRVFLHALAKVGTVTHAAKAAGIHRPEIYAERNTDPSFAQAWLDALETFADELEHVAYQVAVVGWKEPVFFQGQRVAWSEQKRSERILELLLRAKRPSQYRDRVDVVVAVQEQARRVAESLGLDPAEFVALAERIARGEEMPHEESRS